jgi:hypothetical protein
VGDHEKAQGVVVFWDEGRYPIARSMGDNGKQFPLIIGFPWAHGGQIPP